MKNRALLHAIFLSLASSVFAGSILPREAKDHVGELTLVKGSVDGFKSIPGETFLYMGGPFPKNTLTIFCPAKTGITAEALRPYLGKTIFVSGKIDLYQGHPEIILNSLSQLTPP